MPPFRTGRPSPSLVVSVVKKTAPPSFFAS
jgi:hypothetical protein